LAYLFNDPTWYFFSTFLFPRVLWTWNREFLRKENSYSGLILTTLSELPGSSKELIARPSQTSKHLAPVRGSAMLYQRDRWTRIWSGWRYLKRQTESFNSNHFGFLKPQYQGKLCMLPESCLKWKLMSSHNRWQKGLLYMTRSLRCSVDDNIVSYNQILKLVTSKNSLWENKVFITLESPDYYLVYLPLLYHRSPLRL